MYQDTINHFAQLGKKKADLLQHNTIGFNVAAMMAGAYVGLGIILIFSVAASIDPAWQKLIMGVSFGIALTLVVFAGSELFTGHTMYMTISGLKKLTNLKDLVKVWSASWSFNLFGCILLAVIFVIGGGGALLGNGEPLLHKVASYKMNSGAVELIARAILCNWLVCLALWTSARTTNDAAKILLIFWCLFAFIASGYEHSVANMTLLSIALLSSLFSTANEAITLAGMGHNLLWVTLGNIVGGSIFMASAYWVASGESNQVVKQEQTINNPATLN